MSVIVACGLLCICSMILSALFGAVCSALSSAPRLDALIESSLLERENRNPHKRVSELEKARQRMQQQAKHIQEIRDAYEQRHRNLSEFVDFVKR